MGSTRKCSTRPFAIRKTMTRKEPVPYVFMSMAFFQISESSDEELLEKYSKALRTPKYASGVSKDKEREYITSTWITSMTSVVTMNQAEMYVDEEKFTKAKSYYKYLWTLDVKTPALGSCTALCSGRPSRP